MSRTPLIALVLLLVTLPALAARNVILLIGDGMDDQQLTIARNYLLGAEGRLGMDDMPVRATSQVLTVDERGARVYVADSANSATSMATGKVTSRGRISTSAGSNQPLETLLEIAQQRGLRTGLVTTSSVTDATPAAFVAHISKRTCEGPDSIQGIARYGVTTPPCPAFFKANGGPGSIAEQMANSRTDIILGGGLKHFEPIAEGDTRSVLTLAQANGFTLVTDPAAAATAPPGKLLGLFADSHLPVRMRGDQNREAEAPNPSWANHLHRYLGSVSQPAPMRCEPNPDFAATPSLQKLTEIALERLANDAGFFLMVESASIDKQAHERRPCGSIGEVQQLDEAVAVALTFAGQNPDTLVLVTADHGHAAQLVPATSLFDYFGIPIYSPGRIARLQTDESAILAINYATNNFPYEEHTGTQVPLLANEAGRGRVPGMVTQPEIYGIMRAFLFPDDPATNRQAEP